MQRMFRWILDDTRALLSDLRALGERARTRWQWLRLKTRHRVDEAAGNLENVRRGAQAETRMCRECRALIPNTARVCPECGHLPGRRVSRGMGRVVENMMPGFVSVTSTILTLNMVCYGLSLMVNSWMVAENGLAPDLHSAAWEISLAAMGAGVPVLVADGDVWRLVTMIFLHGGLLHLLMNCWAILTVGPLLEEIYGAKKFAVSYLSTGIAGSVASFAWYRGGIGPHIGASGAICGLIGLAAVWGWRRGGRLGEGIKGQMVQWAVYVLVLGFMFKFDNAAHLGGLLGGGLMGLLINDKEPRSALGSRAWDVMAFACGLIVVGSFVLVGMRAGDTRYQELLRWVMSPQ